jgi:hypothetical protein
MHMASPQVWFSMQVMYWWRLSKVNDNSVNNVMDKLELEVYDNSVNNVMDMDKLELEVYDDRVIPSWTNWNWMMTVIKLRQSWTSRNSKEPDE